MSDLILRAELTGGDTVTIGSTVLTANAPVLALCRELVAAGHDPALQLECYRGNVLALTVCSIGLGASLNINSKGTAFVKRRQAVRIGPLVRPDASRQGIAA